MTDTQSYYARFRGRVTGPFPVADLQRMAGTGRLTRMHELSSDSQRWQRAGELDWLFVAPSAEPVESPDDVVVHFDSSIEPVTAADEMSAPQTVRERQWHYELQGKPAGPVAESALRLMIRQQQVQGHTRIWAEGMGNWIDVASSELRNEMTAATTAPTPPQPPAKPAPARPSTAPPAARQAAAESPDLQSATDTPADKAAGFPLQRTTMVVAAGVGMCSTFLPWATSSQSAVSGMAGHGWLTFVLFGCGIALSFLGHRRDRLTGWRRLAALLPSAMAGAFGLLTIVAFHVRGMDPQTGGSALGGMYEGATQLAAGVYLVVFASLAVMSLAFVVRR